MCSITKVQNNPGTNIVNQPGAEQAKGNLAGMPAQKATPPGESPAAVGGNPAWKNEMNNIKGDCNKCGGGNKADIGKILSSVGDLLKSLGSLLQNCQSKMNCKPPSQCKPGCVQPPKPENGCHPSGGGLKTDGNCVTTPGGYKITPTGSTSWKVEGPDGKSTTVHGDPHVSEGDGGKWDFKRDSAFVLPDGTQINVTTTPPGGNGMTVTKQLDIINGNDHVAITDVNKGKGKIGQVTQDGQEQKAAFANKDVIKMGNETDDWSFQGKEIIGDNKGGESFKLGKELVDQTDRFGGGEQWAGAIDKALGGENKNGQNGNSITQALEALGQLFTALSQILKTSGVNV